MSDRITVTFNFEKTTSTNWFRPEVAANFINGTVVALYDTNIPDGKYRIIDRVIDFNHALDSIEELTIFLERR